MKYDKLKPVKTGGLLRTYRTKKEEHLRTPLANAKLMRKWGKSKSVINFIYNKTHTLQDEYHRKGRFFGMENLPFM